jgi:hypothetical protein
MSWFKIGTRKQKRGAQIIDKGKPKTDILDEKDLDTPPEYKIIENYIPEYPKIEGVIGKPIEGTVALGLKKRSKTRKINKKKHKTHKKHKKSKNGNKKSKTYKRKHH